MDAPLITLGNASATLIEPSPIAVYGMLDAAMTDLASRLAIGAAALRLSWPDDRAWPVKPRPVAWRPGQSMVEYGGTVFDGLHRGDVDRGMLSGACVAALNWCMSSIVTEAEVAQAEGFSVAAGEE